MLAAENWCLKVENKVYGPYTTQQMRKFAHEGRLASWSLVSPAGATAWREARRETIFATFFGSTKPIETLAPAAKAFGKRSDCEYTPNDDNPTDEAKAPTSASAVKTKSEKHTDVNKSAESHDISSANFVVIFDVVSAAASRVEAAMLSLGPAFRIAENVWHVSCELTAVGVRNAIAPYLRGSESIFVVDASRGRASWSNYAPEPHAKISAAYLKSKQY